MAEPAVRGRTPLTLILGPLETALGDPTLPSEYERTLATMHRNALRLLQLVNTVLDFSQLESGRMSVRYRPTDLAGYTARLASTFRSAVARAGLRLEDFLVAHRLTEADRFDLSVAISEAAANAIEHPRSPGEPFVRLDVTIRDDELVAVVRDSGQWREEPAVGFRGRGLALIEALAGLTVTRGPTGTSVTLRRRFEPGT